MLLLMKCKIKLDIFRDMKSISNTEMKVFSISLQSDGQIIVPPDVQEQLNLTEGVELTLLQIGEILLLTPKVPKVPQIAE